MRSTGLLLQSFSCDGLLLQTRGASPADSQGTAAIKQLNLHINHSTACHHVTLPLPALLPA